MAYSGDFWGFIRDMMAQNTTGEKAQSAVNQLQLLQQQNKWKAPKQSEDMLSFASLLNDWGLEDEANNLIMQMVGQGYINPNKFRMGDYFQPLYQQWGLRAPSSQAAGGGGAGALGNLASIFGF